jgi:Fic family protein
MYFKNKKINGRKYKYSVKTVRLPDKTIKHIEIIYKNQSEKELKTIFDEKEKLENFKFALNKYKSNYIFSEEEIKKLEEIRLNYKKITKKLNKQNLKDLFDRFTANFTYESNAIEGNSLTLKDVAIVMFENSSLKGKDLREIYVTRNSREVVELIIKNKFDISSEGLTKMHKILVRDMGINAGYKKIPNFITGSDLETTLPENVYSAITNLIKFYEENKEKIHPVELSAILHGKFEEIHPFDDGNGRVGRFLINVILMKNKYPPLIIRKTQRIAYLKALENFDKGHQDTLRRFILERFKETYKKFFEVYIKYI